jgi:hypothetical protein
MRGWLRLAPAPEVTASYHGALQANLTETE